MINKRHNHNHNVFGNYLQMLRFHAKSSFRLNINIPNVTKRPVHDEIVLFASLVPLCPVKTKIPRFANGRPF